MKPIQSTRQLVNSANFQTHDFGIKSENLSHLITLLRDDIYSDKILAVIREYSCNAYDANVQAGRQSTPILVTLPTQLCAEFKVRDYGHGMSPQDIIDTFTSYGESTKRNSDDMVGVLGIGSKSGFAYGDNFLVTSFNNGVKTTYDCVLDQSNTGKCLVLSSEYMQDGEQDGVEISITVKPSDISTFRNKAKQFFKFWNVKPIIVGQDESFYNAESPVFSGTGWEIHRQLDYTTRSYAVMGNIAYPINWSVVKLDPEFNDIFSFLAYESFMFRFSIGELQFAPSREMLQYTDKTNQALNAKLRVFISEFKPAIQAQMDACKDLLEAKRFYMEITSHASPLGHLKEMFSDGLTWNGIQINKNTLGGFHMWDAETGYIDVSQQESNVNYRNRIRAKTHASSLLNYTLDRKNRTKLYKAGYRGEGNNLIHDKDAVVLLYNADKTTHIRKAVDYLMETKSVRMVSVLHFKNSTSQTEAFKHFNLQYVPMVKYSDIATEVKKRTVVTPRKPASTTVCIKRISFQTHTTFSKWTSLDAVCEHVETDIYDQTESMYYIDSSTWGTLDKYDFLNLASKINKGLKLNINHVYMLPAKIVESKKFKNKTNFINLRDKITTEINAQLNNEQFINTVALSYITHRTYNLKQLFRLDFCKLTKINNNSAVYKLGELYTASKAFSYMDSTDLWFDDISNFIPNLYAMCENKIKMVNSLKCALSVNYTLLYTHDDLVNVNTTELVNYINYIYDTKKV